MESTFIYLLKSNALIAVFYLLYYFLVQKETFFNSSRYFLLSGLFASVLAPLFIINKVVYVYKQESYVQRTSNLINNHKLQNDVNSNNLNFTDFLTIGYAIIVIVLVTTIVLNFISLYKLLRKYKIEIVKPFILVDVNENISPFSFLKYIVFNSSLYSTKELENIINHEKVHSQEKHSIDVLIAKLFCVVFWYNPFVWLYKKAVLQNLEYIADNKAIKNIKDKKAYQMTLLKVVTDQNCLQITNNFYQSLIKKRIVMLNKNQSKQKNAWKFAVIIPVLVLFMALFQVKVKAQEKFVKLPDGEVVSKETKIVLEVGIDKNSTDLEIKKDCDYLKKEFNVDLKATKVVRNSKNEITSISIMANDNKGSESTHDVTSDVAITPFTFTIKKDLNGKGEFGFYDENVAPEIGNSDSVPPTPPTPPVFPKMPKVPTAKLPKNLDDKKAVEKYATEFEKFQKEFDDSIDMKKFEADMKIFEEKMKKFEIEMKEYEKEILRKQEKINSEN